MKLLSTAFIFAAILLSLFFPPAKLYAVQNMEAVPLGSSIRSCSDIQSSGTIDSSINHFDTLSLRGCALYLNQCTGSQQKMRGAAIEFIGLMSRNLPKADSIVICYPGTDLGHYAEVLTYLFVKIAEQSGPEKIELLISSANAIFPGLPEQNSGNYIFDACSEFLYKSNYYMDCKLRFTLLYAMHSMKYDRQGLFFKSASTILQDDYEIALSAVKKSCSALEAASQRLRGDRTIVLAGIDCSLQFASDSIRDDEGVCLLAIQSNWQMVKYSSPRLKDDSSFAVSVLHINAGCFQYFSDRVRDIRDIARFAVLQDSSMIMHISIGIQNDTTFAWPILILHPELLPYFSDGVRDNPNLIAYTVTKLPEMMRYASVRLKDDTLLAKSIVMLHPGCYQYFSDNVRDNRELAMFSALRDSSMIPYFSIALKNDTTFARPILRLHPSFFRFFSDQVRDNKDIAMFSVLSDSSMIPYLSGALKNDTTFALPILKLHPECFRYFSSNVRDNGNLALFSVLRDSSMIEYVSDRLKTSTTFALAVLSVHPEMYPYFSSTVQAEWELAFLVVSADGGLLAFVPVEFKDDSIIVFSAVRNKGLALQYASNRLRGNRFIVKTAVEQAGCALRYAIGFTDDEEICFSAIANDPSAMSYIYGRLKGDTVFARRILAIQPTTYSSFFNSVKNTRSLIRLAVSLSGSVMKDVPSQFRDDKEIALAAARQNGYTIWYFSDRLKEDKEILLAAIEFNSSEAELLDYRGVCDRVTLNSRNLISETMHLLGLTSYFSRGVLLNRYELSPSDVRKGLEALWGAQLLTRDTLDQRPVCVAVHATDPTFPLSDPYLHAISKHYRLYFYNADTDDSFVSFVLDATKNRSRQADVLVIGGHGTNGVLRFGLQGSSVELDERRYLDTNDIDCISSLRSCVKPGGIVIHQSCSNAALRGGGNGSSRDLAGFAHAKFWPDAYSYAAEKDFKTMFLAFQNGCIGSVLFDKDSAVVIPPETETAIDVPPAHGHPPTDITLHQNYPNPFRASTTISYHLVRPAYVTLSVYNTLGQKVALPELGNKAAGVHTVELDASRLSPGMYYYELKAGDRVEMKKLTVER